MSKMSKINSVEIFGVNFNFPEKAIILVWAKKTNFAEITNEFILVKTFFFVKIG